MDVNKEEKKVCSKCKELKHVNNFYPDNIRNGFMRYCKSCNKKKIYEWKEKNPKKLKKIISRYYDKNIKQYKGSLWHIRKRIIAIQIYSDGYMNCALCGENNIDVLDIDHINGGGIKHKKNEKYSSLTVWLEKNNYPDGFRILCKNCNYLQYLYRKDVELYDR